MLQGQGPKHQSNKLRSPRGVNPGELLKTSERENPWLWPPPPKKDLFVSNFNWFCSPLDKKNGSHSHGLHEGVMRAL